MLEEHLGKLREMKEKIDSIEQEALHLKSLGDGVPVIEKNVQILLGAVYCLQFGISDIVECQSPGANDR
jgi:hypothetical protein